ncbi:MAG: 3-oxoacyl-[acyl-carrier-protein] reductase [Alphaproteobacteria bacterium]|nr:3-oxoacyl-[acyl-carrier-protein] reductase [Alphaproteobacteria bacterium]
MFRLEGKKALVTGAAGGIGRAIVKTLHALGATVGITDISKEALDAFAAELGERVYVFEANLTDGESIKELVKNAEATMGQIDILVNNAGITKDGLAMRMADDQFKGVLDVNLIAPFMLTRAAMPGMMKRRYGRIINMASIVGVMGNPGQANYCASKGGLIAMTKAIAAEMASRGVTANCVAPGFVKTRMTEVLPEDVKERMLKAIPLARLGEPQDIANAVAFLASDEAGYITGQTIHVNGGMAMI